MGTPPARYAPGDFFVMDLIMNEIQNSVYSFFRAV
jgi:hypothetical protein